MRFHSLFRFKTLCRPLSNNRGQGLIEYLVIVALVGVATIGIMRVIGGTVTHRFNNIATSLGEGSNGAPTASKTVLQSKDLTSFMKGSKVQGGGAAGDDNNGQQQ